VSQVRDNFEAAVKKKDWKTAYTNFRGLNMDEMLRSLYAMAKAIRDEFWDQRLLQLVYPDDLPRWEYAFTVATFHVKPAVAPGDLATTGQVADAEKFLKAVVKKPASNLDRNLGLSMQAVNHVLTSLKLEGSNWDYYQKKAGTYEYYLHKAAAEKDPVLRAQHLADAAKHKNKLDVCLYDTVRPGAKADAQAAKATSTIDLYRISANQARRNGCGNCGENSILAFLFLYDLGVRPLDRLGVDQDHAFVVIGRAAGDVNDFKSWGKAAAVCDPWAQGLQKGNTSIGTYPGSEFEQNMTSLVGKFKVTQVYRVE